MANTHRGEIEAEIGGERRRLVLTLGALAELEAAFGADDLVALAERFGSGRLKAADLTNIIGAGLRGAGEAVTDEEVARMAVADGAQGYVRIAGALIAATFGRRTSAGPSVAAGGGRPQRPPFAWTEIIGFGLGVLRLSPDAFWRMTPRELSYAIAAVAGPPGGQMARGEFDRLMALFPDRRE
ncbi:MAG: hypothetical protein QOG83_3116 [Alphaproteobacteria bacterium]|nr:hypothetical protein [Alphaproteobacteria bacterium]